MDAHPLSRANTLPGNLLRRCHQISVAIFLRKCEVFQLTQLQYVMLSALEELGPLDQVTLGRQTALDRNTVAGVVRKLENRGLVSRRRNPEDRRAMRVTITEAGRELRARVAPLVEEVQEEILAPLPPDDRKTLGRLLKRIADEHNHRSQVPIVQAH
ncbi:MarR family winged helix-turn-helix transcriptional regulator [Halomonas organivorans]|uniref:DNA-binding MarR family transcriptional regulator n=1 Tax=Halomonas organivorans TaxID=257772 RepID=A0A7W5G3N0_9GAMM|nr:MarR family transcriptional regulator [Halomonas organivorans]MBB3139249.1 DNA-binding MarR family transcriptional regulator [Halomonas organivorans]